MVEWGTTLGNLVAVPTALLSATNGLQIPRILLTKGNKNASHPPAWPESCIKVPQAVRAIAPQRNPTRRRSHALESRSALASTLPSGKQEQMAHSLRRDSGNQVAVIGAGPYGLAASAHLLRAGVDARVFGQPMDFWRDHMPAGMLLRSSWEASQISDPTGSLGLGDYGRMRGKAVPAPVPLRDFTGYGIWFQQQAVPQLETRSVSCIEHGSRGVSANHGRRRAFGCVPSCRGRGHRPICMAPRAVLWPPSVAGISLLGSLRPAGFAGRRVAVVGGGQSALESAALLHEAGADAEVIARAPLLRWVGRSRWLRRLPKPLSLVFYPSTDVGPPGLNWLIAVPGLFRRLPRSMQDRIAYRSIGPAGAEWLRARLRDVKITVGNAVRSAEADGDRVRLLLDDDTDRMVDHVLLATGYRVDVSRYPFLSSELLQRVRRANGYPLLGPGFESSVPGLHFLGAPAAWSFGPLMRFVSGTWYSAPALTRVITAGGQTGGQKR